MSALSPETEDLRCRPIGYISTARALKFDSPSQPDPRVCEESVIELVGGGNFEQAVSDLVGFERVWLVWWFHRNRTWRPKVLPPRGEGIKRGVFATRSPHRPNPIGISAVPLLRVEGRRVYVGSNDLLDGTPILDIKPYVPEVDSFPGSKTGWLHDVTQAYAEPPRFQVGISPVLRTQLDWLKGEWGINLLPRVREILARDPSPHRTRRIVRCGQGRSRIGCGAWRIFFRIEGNSVILEEVTPGYPPRALFAKGVGKVPNGDAQRAFLQRWGEKR